MNMDTITREQLAEWTTTINAALKQDGEELMSPLTLNTIREDDPYLEITGRAIVANVWAKKTDMPGRGWYTKYWSLVDKEEPQTTVLMDDGINWCWFWELQQLPDGTWHVLDHWREHKSEPFTDRSKRHVDTVLRQTDGCLHCRKGEYKLSSVSEDTWVQKATHTKLEVL